MTRSPRKTPEQAIQYECVRQMKLLQKKGHVFRYKANCHESSYKEWQHWENMGAIGGEADLEIFRPDGQRLHIELKAMNGIWKQNQKDYAADLAQYAMNEYKVCWSLSEAMATITGWLGVLDWDYREAHGKSLALGS